MLKRSPAENRNFTLISRRYHRPGLYCIHKREMRGRHLSPSSSISAAPAEMIKIDFPFILLPLSMRCHSPGTAFFMQKKSRFNIEPTNMMDHRRRFSAQYFNPYTIRLRLVSLFFLQRNHLFLTFFPADKVSSLFFINHIILCRNDQRAIYLIIHLFCLRTLKPIFRPLSEPRNFPVRMPVKNT